MITKVKSSSSNKEYEVDTMQLTCDCPHYRYRLTGTGEICKHIKQVLDAPHKFKDESIIVINNNNSLLSFIKGNNNAVDFVEKYSEKDLNKLKLTGQVYENHGRLSIL